MQLDEEFRSLGLTKQQTSLAWEARAKIIWGDRPDDVHSWLTGRGIDPLTADRIVAVATSERAGTMRKNGARDLLFGIPITLAGAGGGIGVMAIAKTVNVPTKGLAVLFAIVCIAMMYGAHLTWRGFERILGGARVDGAASDVDD